MGFLKKEWKTIFFVLWLFGITIFFIHFNGQLNQLQEKNTKMASTIDSIESVIISTDASVANSSEKIEKIRTNVSFLVQKVRRR